MSRTSQQTHFSFAYSEIEGGALNVLKNLGSIEHLLLPNTQINDSAMLVFASHILNLKQLDVSWSAVTDGGVETL